MDARSAWIPLVLLAGAMAGSAAAAVDAVDSVVVEGDTLRGEVRSLSPRGLELATVYGDGTLEIPWEAVQEISVQHPFHVIHGEDGREASGLLLGLEDGELLVGDAPAQAERIPTEEIQTGLPDERFQESFYTRMRSRYRHWKLGFDLGFNWQESRVDKRRVNLGLEVERRKGPSRIHLWTEYAFELQRKKPDPFRTTKDELDAVLTVEHDLRESLFAYGMAGYEFDYPRDVQNRLFPNAGVGYRFASERGWELSPFVGFGYVYQDFESVGRRDYPGLAMGFTLEGKLWRRLSADMTLFYMPQITDFEEDWLFRWRLTLSLPLWGPLAARLRLSEGFDNNPSPQIGDNKFQALLGLGIDF